jgi:bifunctional DNA-binding transcriptional regulator/antitoxin component of YhaV-PrlF toxin-antitoxin module
LEDLSERKPTEIYSKKIGALLFGISETYINHNSKEKPMRIEKLKIDAKGRIVLPYAFRSTMGMKEGDFVFASMDDAKTSIVISPFGEKQVYRIDFEMVDAPGSFMKILKALADKKVDVVATEAHSLVRGKQATGRIFAKLKSKEIKPVTSMIKKAGAQKVKSSKI